MWVTITGGNELSAPGDSSLLEGWQEAEDMFRRDLVLSLPRVDQRNVHNNT